MDTIFALASAPGRAGISVIRVSGPGAFEVASRLAGTLPSPRYAGLRRLVDHAGQELDQALVLWFPAPASFTGEDVVELHVHGSIAVVQAVLAELSLLDARLAEPGEFTRRALENDRMDLTQVEGLSDLIEAETELQRKQALRTLSGHLSATIETWRADLVRAAALIEATIDFVDEDVPVDVTPEVMDLLGCSYESIDKELRGFLAAERLRTGFEVAIVGPPNAGKSTLLNALAKRDAALTSDIAGTTRDVIEVRMNLSGMPVTLLDTAGLRATGDVLEASGVERALERAKQADLRIFLVEDIDALLMQPEADDLVRKPKADLSGEQEGAISGRTGYGLDGLMRDITTRLQARASGAGLITHERHRVAMARTLESLEKAQCSVAMGTETYDIAAEDIRIAIRALEAVIGRIDVENLLDEIFASFCLGK